MPTIPPPEPFAFLSWLDRLRALVAELEAAAVASGHVSREAEVVTIEDDDGSERQVDLEASYSLLLSEPDYQAAFDLVCDMIPRLDKPEEPEQPARGRRRRKSGEPLAGLDDARAHAALYAREVADRVRAERGT